MPGTKSNRRRAFEKEPFPKDQFRNSNPLQLEEQKILKLYIKLKKKNKKKFEPVSSLNKPHKGLKDYHNKPIVDDYDILPENQECPIIGRKGHTATEASKS